MIEKIRNSEVNDPAILFAVECFKRSQDKWFIDMIFRGEVYVLADVDGPSKTMNIVANSYYCMGLSLLQITYPGWNIEFIPLAPLLPPGKPKKRRGVRRRMYQNF
ncbi:hypothetical protein [Leptothoe kymatousa]|uniref:Uncharacterized protein n=1 Tax=Leptothoe kymatousa TAU-MAC 1615 TaxID=2364775 RepID=A0ABS5Y3Z7_9CYAN|nr:hypothetical protein [Leptothoe kymatousa]MBT9312555.1 hypothetical protein [Leptothoe kymatousa TAU-MAC 1615]